MKKFTLSFLTLLWATFSFSQTVSTFENLNLAPDTFWNGSDLTGGFSSGNAYFANDYDTTYSSWSGFAYSNKKDTTTAGSGNQYSAVTGTGYGGSPSYAVANGYGDLKVRLTGNTAGTTLTGVYVTNSTYAALSMRDGDQFAKKFGGPTGNDDDWFKLTAQGWLNGNPTANSIEFYLADYRFANNTQDYIVKSWQWFNLQPLGNVDSVAFYLSSSDTGMFGMNTPAYFVIDNFNHNTSNVAPIAANDEYFITYAQDTAFAVLSNDFDTTAAPLTVAITAGPLIPGAVASVGNDNRIYYTPATGISANDTIDYRICDDAGLCANARVIVRVYGITGVEETATATSKVYPNPFTDVLNIQSNQSLQKAELFNAAGQLVRSVDLQFANTINTGELTNGVYFLKLTGNGNTYTQRVIKN